MTTLTFDTTPRRCEWCNAEESVLHYDDAPPPADVMVWPVAYAQCKDCEATMNAQMRNAGFPGHLNVKAAWMARR